MNLISAIKTIFLATTLSFITKSTAQTINKTFSFTNSAGTMSGTIVGNVTANEIRAKVSILTYPYPYPYELTSAPGIWATTGSISPNWSGAGMAGIIQNDYTGATIKYSNVACGPSNISPYTGPVYPLPSGSGYVKFGIRISSPSAAQGLYIFSIPYRNGKFLNFDSTNPTHSNYTEAGLTGPKTTHKLESLIGDPVNITTGAFYDSETDIVIPAAFPIIWTKMYSSDYKINNSLGMGWRSNHVSYLEKTLTELKLADNDDTLGFTPDPLISDLWVLTQANNPTIRTLPATVQPLKETIVKTLESGIEVYTHYKPSTGVTSRYEVTSFPITVVPSYNLVRERPYLVKKTDSIGNSLTYTYETLSTNLGYGQVTKITANSGEWLQINYNADDNIASLLASDGRTVQYTYHADYIRNTTLPTGVTISYIQDNAGQIVQISKPGSRRLDNVYTVGKVTQQSATLTTSTPVINAKFVYTAGKTTAENILGHKSEHEFVNGQLSKVVDRNGQTQLYDWYSTTDPLTGAFSNALKTSTDPRGAVTTHTYTENGSIATTTLTQTP